MQGTAADGKGSVKSARRQRRHAGGDQIPLGRGVPRRPGRQDVDGAAPGRPGRHARGPVARGAASGDPGRLRGLPGAPGPAVTGGPVLPELGIRLFRALYDAYDLIVVDGVSIAVPKDGTIPVFTGDTLTDVAWQIAEHASGVAGG